LFIYNESPSSTAIINLRLMAGVAKPNPKMGN